MFGKPNKAFLRHYSFRDVIFLEKKIIALPRLNNLSPTMESTALKLMEEAGELAQAIGKLRGLSGRVLFTTKKK